MEILSYFCLTPINKINDTVLEKSNVVIKQFAMFTTLECLLHLSHPLLLQTCNLRCFRQDV